MRTWGSSAPSRDSDPLRPGRRASKILANRAGLDILSPVPDRSPVAGRVYAPIYHLDRRREDIHLFLVEAVQRSGGTVLYASESRKAPVFLGIQARGDERLGVLCYPFRCNPPPIAGRPPDEHRVQIRYGSERSWQEDEHPLGRDLAGVDTTVVLGIHRNADLFVGLDPALYDPLPMGISVEFKDAIVQDAGRTGWQVWERVNRIGRRRNTPRAREGLETLIAFRPDRLLDYVRFEQQASGLRLDPPLRYRAAEVAAVNPPGTNRGIHALEKEFELTSRQILEIIALRTRLTVAVKGGVAEHHLGLHLQRDAAVRTAELIDRDGEPDFQVEMTDGRTVLVECKNISPRRYVDGTAKVEVQKTRSQRDDPAGRLYRPGQFDIVAACMFSVSGIWDFRFKSTRLMQRDERFPDRLAAIQRIDGTWQESLTAALAEQ